MFIFGLSSNTPCRRFFVNRLNKLLYLTAAVLMGSSAYADIYEWTDENGVKHFTNYSPPDRARVIMKTEEVPFDETADSARSEMERLERLELARLEIAEREAELERREAEAAQRLAEANRQAEETLQKAAEMVEAFNSYSDSYGRGYSYGYYPYAYPYLPYYQRWHRYGSYDGIYLKRPYYPYQHKNRKYINHFSGGHKYTQFRSSHHSGSFSQGSTLRPGNVPARTGHNHGGRQSSRVGIGLRK
jgi:hypothetical protein